MLSAQSWSLTTLRVQMKVMQTPLVLFFTLVFLSTSVITTPIPVYVPGDIVKARPKHWGDGNRTAGKHFGVVVGQNPTNDKYKVAHTSHSLPKDKYPQQDDAVKYHEKFGDTKINTGRPVEVANEHLYPAGHQDGWHKMEDEKLVALKAQISIHSSFISRFFPSDFEFRQELSRFQTEEARFKRCPAPKPN